MNDDLKIVTSKAWLKQGAKVRSWMIDQDRHTGRIHPPEAHIAFDASLRVAADFCKKMAEEAEGREKCAAGEHEFVVYGTLMPKFYDKPGTFIPVDSCWCLRCQAPKPTDTPTRDDIEAALEWVDGKARDWGKDPCGRYFSVIKAVITDAQKRGVLP